MGINRLTLATKLTARVNEACEGIEGGQAEILKQVTGTTAELLKWWFQQDFIDARTVNFHEGQRQAILNTIYAHEVLNVETLQQLYEHVAGEVILESHYAAEMISADKNAYPKYCMKMATGTGKTWVLQGLLLWQLLNANRDPNNPRFTRNFLIVAPGLIVYDRLLDAFLGKERGGQRNFDDSDLSIFRELFIPDTYRDEVFRFVQGAVCPKEQIGRRVTSGGIIAISNWHILSEEGEAEEEADIETPGILEDPKEVVTSLLPITPGKSAGNDLSQLNRKWERGNILNFLRELPDLMVFNDEAHHIHDFKREGEATEVEWQKSLNAIAEPKGARFCQIDFSATPYNQVGTGKKVKISYFPHIIVDFDLKTAMRLGLVKSLVLDKRKEIGALSNKELEFKAERDEDGNPVLSEGQRVMLRAGLAKLKKLERDYTRIDKARRPKLMVMCEDTSVTPLVEQFLQDEGLNDDEILRVDSNRKGEMKQSDWYLVRERLFDMDAHETPRVIVSVLMLREGFDVSNICVIVPLRSSQARILLEQTIGRGLRLMWRGEEFEDIKQENRRLIRNKKAPNSMIDVLSIVEHPAFQSFYDELMADGLAAEIDDDDDDGKSSTGDLISVGLREDYKQYDFSIPFILREREEGLQERKIDIMSLAPFTGFLFEQIKKMIGKGEKFISEDVQTSTRFGDYRVDGGVMTATGYNDYIARVVRRVSDLMGTPLTGSSKVFANQEKYPYIQANKPQLAAWIDGYIRRRLFDQSINPFEDENWRVLLVDTVTEHIIRTFSTKLLETEENETLEDVEIAYRHLSEVSKIPMREGASLLVKKCIYERLPYPSRNGQLEKAFIEMADNDSGVDAFCKIHEQKHDFVRLHYIKQDGLPGFYFPDFLVRIEGTTYLVETKAQDQMTHPNVQRKRKAAVAWCTRINSLEPEQRGGSEWSYVLLGEAMFYEWHDKSASMKDMLDFAKLRPVEILGQAKLEI